MLLPYAVWWCAKARNALEKKVIFRLQDRINKAVELHLMLFRRSSFWKLGVLFCSVVQPS